VPSEADLKMEITISRMLRVGVSVAALVVLIGEILYLWQAHGVRTDYGYFHGVPIPIDHFAPVLEGIRHFDSRSIIRFGVLLLIATPIVRVAFCLYSFGMQKDKLYIPVSATVLAVLLYSLLHR
jgi:uncharacterized membrane protein